ncbi:hypothetical protein PYCC9005_002148 [Savitreella phatthalungensis]
MPSDLGANLEHPQVALFASPPVKAGTFLLPDGCAIDYEVHGSGPRRLCLIMGLLASKYSWRETVAWFADSRVDFTILVYDNRGAGKSDKPWGRYTTSQLAQDTLWLLNHVGWTEERSVHLNGVSMGGMIALEVAKLAPLRIRSLTLTSTCAKHQNPPRTRAQSLASWFNYFRPKPSVEVKVRALIDSLFNDSEWLAANNVKYPDYDTNADRVFTQLFSRAVQMQSPSISGQIGQILACITHNCSFRDLASIGGHVPDILVVTGMRDALIDPTCSDVLYRELSLNGQRQGIRNVRYATKGHALMVEAEEEYHKELEQLFAAADKRYGRSSH